MLSKKGLTMFAGAVLSLSLVLTGCGSNTSSNSDGSGGQNTTSSSTTCKPRTLKFSHTDSPQGARQKAALYFAKKVKEYTNGCINVKVYPSGQLANDQKGLEQLQLGGIAFTATGNVVYANFDKAFNLTGLPYLVTTYKQGWALYNSPWVKNQYKILAQKYGIHVLATWEAGFRSFTTKKPMKTPADAKGMKMRIFNNDMILWTMQAFGFKPVAMPVTSAYLAIKQGTVDGQENPIDTIYSQKFYQVAPYITLTRHIYGPIPMAISQKIWKTLTPSEQKGIQKAALQAQSLSRNLVVKDNQKELNYMTSKGAHVYKPNLKPWEQAAQPVYAKARKKYGAKLVNELLKEAAKIKKEYPAGSTTSTSNSTSNTAS